MVTLVVVVMVVMEGMEGMELSTWLRRRWGKARPSTSLQGPSTQAFARFRWAGGEKGRVCIAVTFVILVLLHGWERYLACCDAGAWRSLGWAWSFYGFKLVVLSFGCMDLLSRSSRYIHIAVRRYLLLSSSHSSFAATELICCYRLIHLHVHFEHRILILFFQHSCTGLVYL